MQAVEVPAAVRLDGRTLTIEGLAAVAYGKAAIVIDPTALRLV